LSEGRPATVNGQTVFPLGGHTGPPVPVIFTELGAVIVIAPVAAKAESPGKEMGTKMEAQNRIAA